METSEKMGPKICIVTPEYPPENWGGLARTVQRVALHARDMGLDVHVAHFKAASTPLVLLDSNRKTAVIDGVQAHTITVGREEFADACRELWDCPHTLTLRMMYQSLERLHTRERFDLFHSFFLYPVGFITGMLAKRFGAPEIVTLVGNDIKKYVFSPEKVATIRCGLETADRVVALSNDMIDMADSLTPIRSKARVIFNSVEIPNESWHLGQRKNGPFKIGCAGIFKYAKGLPYLIKAVAELRKRRPVRLELVGSLRESEQATYDDIVGSTGVGDGLTLMDALPHEKISEWLPTLDAFCLPSVSEGCPNILMEAMACGVPCVATRTGAMEDLIEDRVSGLLVPWGDSSALERALDEIAGNPESASEMGKAARERMRPFNAERERQEWKSLYGELIGI